MFAASLLAQVSIAQAHGYLAKPVTRNQQQCASQSATCGNMCLVHKSVYMGSGSNTPPSSWAPCQATTRGTVPKANQYYPGQAVDAAFTQVANHGGAVRFYVCPDGSDSLACFYKHPVKTVTKSGGTDGTWTKAGKGGCCSSPGTTQLTLEMPDLHCPQDKCTLLWEWHNTGVKDVPGTYNGGAACAEGSIFHNCADISIVSSAPPPPPTPTTTSYAPPTPSPTPTPSPYDPPAPPPWVPTPEPPAPPAPPPPPASNPWNVVAWPNGETMCLDVPGGNVYNGQHLQIWNCNGLASQQWQFQDWNIKLKDENKCVDVPSGNLQAGQLLQIWDCNGLPAQQWGYDTDSRSVFASASEADASLCMDIQGGSSSAGTAVWMWYCDHDLVQQRWYVPPSFGSFNIQSLMQGAFLCLDLLGQYTFNGNAIGAWQCNGFEGQSWIFEADSWNIKWAKDPSKCIDVPGASYTAGTELWIWDCNGSDNQKFGYDPDLNSIYAAASSDASMCLDVPRDETSGASVWLWHCNGASQQMWSVPSVETWRMANFNISAV